MKPALLAALALAAAGPSRAECPSPEAMRAVVSAVNSRAGLDGLREALPGAINDAERYTYARIFLGTGGHFQTGESLTGLEFHLTPVAREYFRTRLSCELPTRASAVVPGAVPLPAGAPALAFPFRPREPFAASGDVRPIPVPRPGEGVRGGLLGRAEDLARTWGPRLDDWSERGVPTPIRVGEIPLRIVSGETECPEALARVSPGRCKSDYVGLGIRLQSVPPPAVPRRD